MNAEESVEKGFADVVLDPVAVQNLNFARLSVPAAVRASLQGGRYARYEQAIERTATRLAELQMFFAEYAIRETERRLAALSRDDDEIF